MCLMTFRTSFAFHQVTWKYGSLIWQKTYENRDGDKPKVKEWHICMAEKVYEESNKICISVKFKEFRNAHVEFAPSGAERSSGVSPTWHKQSLSCREPVGWTSTLMTCSSFFIPLFFCLFLWLECMDAVCCAVCALRVCTPSLCYG